MCISKDIMKTTVWRERERARKAGGGSGGGEVVAVGA